VDAEHAYDDGDYYRAFREGNGYGDYYSAFGGGNAHAYDDGDYDPRAPIKVKATVGERTRDEKPAPKSPLVLEAAQQGSSATASFLDGIKQSLRQEPTSSSTSSAPRVDGTYRLTRDQIVDGRFRVQPKLDPQAQQYEYFAELRHRLQNAAASKVPVKNNGTDDADDTK
jgi:hypothetical protein